MHRELDDALGLTDMAAALIADLRTGGNGRHRIAGFLRQSVYSRLAGYEDVNDAERLWPRPGGASSSGAGHGVCMTGQFSVTAPSVGLRT